MASMIRVRSIVTVAAAALVAAACDRTEPTAPLAAQPAIAFAKVGDACTIDVGPTTTRPLPALHELEGWLADAVSAAGSTVNCGQIRSLDAKMEALTKALNQTEPQFSAACGISGAIVNEVRALVENSLLALPSFPPPFPGGPTNVLAAADALSGRWCAAARGELVGPVM